jgi:hypothetical protein
MNPLNRCDDRCQGHSYYRTGKLRHHRTPPYPVPSGTPQGVAAELLVRIDGLPIDPLAFDADPDAFLRAVFGLTFREAR